MPVRYIGRFAPSPTGPLHLGSLVAALASYVDARAAKGQWLIRIEDVDTQRCSREHEATILRQLYDYGFEHDGEVVRQSERVNLYREALTKLDAQGLLYRCRCTRKKLASTPRNRDGETIYPGTCRDLGIVAMANESTSIRLNLQSLEYTDCILFEDRACGTIEQNVRKEVGDFVLHRADGDFAYQLAVVVDDATQGVTHIVRGTDLLLNTPRQIVLQRALGAATPSYLHVPLIVNAEGEKLSKQTLAQPLPVSLNARMETLSAAWAHLQQATPFVCATPREFMQYAIAAWNPTRLSSSSPTRFASNEANL